MKSRTYEYSRHSGWDSPLGDLASDNTLVVVFGGRDYADETDVFEQLVAAYPDAEIVGCSTSGEIADRRLLDDSLTVAVMQFETTRLRTASARIAEDGASEEAGRSIAKELDGPGLSAVFVLSNGLLVNGTGLVAGMNSVLDDDIVITGGLAGDGEAFERTWVVHGSHLGLDTIVAVGFYGDELVVSHGSQGGWDRFGPKRKITASRGNVLLELDGKPALDLYKEYLGDHAAELPAAGLLFPLEIQHPDDGEKRLVRTILGTDEAENSLTFAGDMPVGWNAQLMKANFDRLVDGAESAAEALGDVEHGSEAVCIAISCVGRRLVLRERTEDEIDAVADLLPQGARLVGFYSYGELSPHVAGEPCDLHNQTMTLTLLSERAG